MPRLATWLGRLIESGMTNYLLAGTYSLLPPGTMERLGVAGIESLAWSWVAVAFTGGNDGMSASKKISTGAYIGAVSQKPLEKKGGE
jgi:hypothetical protein